ncbi:hypothetical protein MJM43_33010, partial [Salmonella enterica subsp. enterica serovar Montevideo]|nr:hypothetical protein [Salmonella enterica subsp. enterica serovar Montevideo]
KSGIAVLIMLLYFSPVLPDNVLRLSFQATGLSSWFYERGATHGEMKPLAMFGAQANNNAAPATVATRKITDIRYSGSLGRFLDL